MSYKENIEKSAEYLRIILKLMTKHNISPTPLNYIVLYEYTSGSNRSIKEAVDKILKRSAPLTPEILEELYRLYISRDNSLLQKQLLIEFKRIMVEISEYVFETGDELESYEQVLQQITDLEDKNFSVEEVRKAVDKVILKTKDTVDSIGNLKNNLNSATDEIDLLRKQLYESKEEAVTDMLTGLSNRRGMENKLINNMNLSKNKGTSLCIMMADIDHFKLINDNYGHLVGDNVLRIIGKTLKDFIKGKDHVARYGGEEFLVILPDTPVDGAVILAEKIRSFLESMTWKEKPTGKSLGRVTLSFGISIFRKDDTLEGLIERADIALFK